MLRDVIAPWELERLRDRTGAMIEAMKGGCPYNRDFLFALDWQTGKRVLYRVEELVAKDPAFLHLRAHPRIARVMQCVLGPNLVCVADAMVLKMPEYGVCSRWHNANRDTTAIVESPTVHAGIYLDDSTPENGCLWVIPGSHRRCGFDLQQMVEDHGFALPGAIPVPCGAGDVLLHREDVVHGSRAVRASGKLRRVVYTVFIRPADQPTARRIEILQGWKRIWAKALLERAALREARAEVPFSWRPSNEHLHVDPGTLGYVDLTIRA